MSNQPLDTIVCTALWQQFDAAINMFENALLACPDSLWQKRLWSAPPPSFFPPQFGEFWYLTYHTLIWFDLYLSGVPEEEFAPPAPFVQGEIDSVETQPDQPYTQAELHAYLVALRQRCHTQFHQLSNEQLRRIVAYPWSKGQPISYLELQLYNLRHVQEHAAQLSLFVGQHNPSATSFRWVPRARDEPES